MVNKKNIFQRELNQLGLTNKQIHYQLNPDELIQDTLRLDGGALSDTGALVVNTGEFTGRCPKDRFILQDDITAVTIDWNEFNQPIEEKFFHVIHQKIINYLSIQEEIWVRDCIACADPRYRMAIRIVTEQPWTNLFAYNMFLRPAEKDLENFETDWIVLSAPGLRLNPAECGIRQHNTSVISFKHKMILIAGTAYTGEIKKGVFSVLNYLLPMHHNVLTMHCSANMDEQGDTSLFFGLSGTGKTTLSTDPSRKLIGDDEHGWSTDGIFNFEGGCYAKCIDLSKEKEPGVYKALRPGALVENTVFFNGTQAIDFSSRIITENTRLSYPLHFIDNALRSSIGNIPNNIFFLTCDASGVLPPISRLTTDQAMYQFISGYTAKIAGTETGITDPKSTFSTCFGAPFLPLHPGKYASLLGKKLRTHKINVWLINTGWTGGPFGIGTRIKLPYTRSMISAALEGKLENQSFISFPVFGFAIPLACPGVPSEILNPVNTWSDKNEYRHKLQSLAQEFINNFKKYAAGVTDDVLAAAPRLK